MVAEPRNIEREVHDLMLTDIPDVVGIRVGSPVRTTDYSVIFL